MTNSQAKILMAVDGDLRNCTGLTAIGSFTCWRGDERKEEMGRNLFAAIWRADVGLDMLERHTHKSDAFA